MASGSIGTQTGTQWLHVNMRDSPSLRTATGFGETFRDLDSLLFVCAVLTELDQPALARPEDEVVYGYLLEDSEDEDEDGDAPPVLRGLDVAFSHLHLETFGRPGPSESQLRSGRVVTNAASLSQQIQVERVSYQSPLEIVLSLAQQAAEYPGGWATALTVGVGSTGVLVANRAVKLWENISNARKKHSEANKVAVEARELKARARRDTEAEVSTKEFEARIREAEAREREADAKLKESEVDLKLAAHNLLRSDVELLRTFYEAETLTPAALLRNVDQAAASLASIESMKVVEE